MSSLAEYTYTGLTTDKATIRCFMLGHSKGLQLSLISLSRNVAKISITK
uniref:Uncharacterized protein n=1 Tax=Anguilla anguilla TaxID=7936 RepID=A0A0E9PQA8_ANGAN